MNALLGPRGRMWPTWDWMQEACWTPTLTLNPREVMLQGPPGVALGGPSLAEKGSGLPRWWR